LEEVSDSVYAGEFIKMFQGRFGELIIADWAELGKFHNL